MKARVSECALREVSWRGREEAVPEGEGQRAKVRESSCGLTCFEPEHRGALIVLSSDHRTYRALLPESASFIQTRNLRLWKLGDEAKVTQGARVLESNISALSSSHDASRAALSKRIIMLAAHGILNFLLAK